MNCIQNSGGLSVCLLSDADVVLGGSLAARGLFPCCSPFFRECLNTGYGLRFSTEIYGSKREKPFFHEYVQEARFVLTEISENLKKPQKPPGIYGRM